MTQNWRTDFNENSAFRERVENRIAQALNASARKGRNKYGPNFVGDPLHQAFEEAIDLSRYLATEI